MSPDRFADLASRVARGLARLERDDVCCGDLTLQQFEALRAIEPAGSLSLGSAAAALGIDVSTASRNLGLLVTRRYLTRRRGREDARQVSFALSKKGRECLATLRCDQRLVYASLLGRIPADRRHAVEEALEVLAVALSGETSAASAASCTPGTCCPPKEKTR